MNRCRMNLHSVIYIVSVLLFNIADCRLLFKKHVVRRQTQELYQNPNQMFQTPYQSQPSYPEQLSVPKINPFPVNPSNTYLEPGYGGLTSGNLGPESSGLASGNINPGPSGLAPRNSAQGKVGLTAGNVVPSNAELAAGNVVPGNAELAAGNVVPGNAELAAGNVYPGYAEAAPGDVAAGNTGLEPGNVAPKYAGLASAYVPPENARFPPQNAALSSGNLGNSGGIGFPPLPQSPENQDTVNENIPNSPSFRYPVTNAPLTPTLQALSNSNSSIYPSSIKLKRRKKNATYKNNELHELLEKGKKLFYGSTDSNETNKSHRLNLIDDYLENDLKENNSTLIPIPKGVQIKTVTKQGKKNINSVVNITSSTQRTLFFDNTTEIENMLEMQMEKNIEDDKGANRGSEEVRIIETERVKPIVNKRLNGLTLLKKKRSYNKIFTAHRKSKRSIRFSTEQPVPKSLFDEMSRRFLTLVNREGRVRKHNNSPKRQITPNFKETGSRKIASPEKLTRSELISDRTEIDDFVKYFLKQMRNYRKSQVRKKSKALWFKERHNGESRNDTEFSTHKSKTAKKNFELIKELSVLLNFSVSWNTVMRNQVKSRNITENQNRLTMNLETTTASVKSSTHQMPLTLVYIGERNDSGLRTTFLFLIITLLSIMSVWFMRGKVYNIRQLSDLNTKSGAYKYYHEGKKDELEKLKYARIENVYLEDYPQLEWQSENGDWLIEKNTDFK